MTDHASYSQLTAYARCGKQYQLQRIQNAPEQPSVWLPAGKAVHAAIEAININHYREQNSDSNSTD